PAGGRLSARCSTRPGDASRQAAAHGMAGPDRRFFPYACHQGLPARRMARLVLRAPTGHRRGPDRARDHRSAAARPETRVTSGPASPSGRVIILGLNAFHADAAAALVRDGVLVAAAEEERFRRLKHWAGFPSQAIAYCLREAGLSLTD